MKKGVINIWIGILNVIAFFFVTLEYKETSSDSISQLLVEFIQFKMGMLEIESTFFTNVITQVIASFLLISIVISLVSLVKRRVRLMLGVQVFISVVWILLLYLVLTNPYLRLDKFAISSSIYIFTLLVSIAMVISYRFNR